jgi:hypothetical protein
MFTGNDIIEFSEAFSTNEACYTYLSSLKWENGFSCPKCGHAVWCKTNLAHVRKCVRCKHKDSATAGTLFHKLKFPIRQAFWLVFLVANSKKGISSMELHRRLSLRQKTCYYFKRKVMAAMHTANQRQAKLQGKVDVDEFFVGGPNKGKRGRSKGNKRVVVMGVELKKGGIQRCFAKHIANGGTKQLRTFFRQSIHRITEVRTDKWRGYRPLQAEYPYLRQEQSEPQRNFRLFHRQVMMLKAWLRGIHHSVKQMQPYLDEFTYRYNQRADHFMFDNILLSMLHAKPIFIKNLNLYWGS